ncbi:hypothetical protein HPB48_022210 [Haemaphysalis longicornis]|uniref:TRAF1-6 MATH domain-containing protein n=1 Tax=Haemaphysalis longicornis TaxID=44386 RepID=A0A9J6FSU5_HAELO|nr:hypothetical protein HPB48_022210 [Haemaphysalis longicornis]
MCAHLKSRCTALVLDTAPEAQPRAEDNKRRHFLEFDRKIDQRVHQLDAKLSLLSSEIASQSEKLVSLCHSNNNLKEALTEQIATASDQTVHRLDRNEVEIKALVAHDKTIEERVGQLDEKLAQLSLKSDSMGDTLTEICQNHTYLKKALTEQLERASGQTLDRFDRNEAEMRTVVANEKTIKERVGDVDAKLDQLSLESGCQRDRVAEVCQNVNNLKEALIEQFGVACSELKASCTKERESLMTAITSTLASVPCDPKTSQRVVTGYAALKEKALQQGWSDSMSDKVYLLRYALSWGIEFRKEGDGVYLYLCAQLHEGKEDDFLDWPFAKELKLSIIHPKTREERLLRETPDVSGTDRKYYCRPVGGSTGVLCFTKTRVGTSDIESGGYVEGDRLLVRLEVAL